eukprot:TRINITY_DN4913_c0_g4_i1.p1 TRINITY_DN4913_c0_g4~~TRINITY_DN4913_c0_g4_i1.p1  ORF type:complete len:201 (-),score=43.75 TRINITY_DN4913_c0_g4_i1:43-645(-)
MSQEANSNKSSWRWQDASSLLLFAGAAMMTWAVGKEVLIHRTKRYMVTEKQSMQLHLTGNLQRKRRTNKNKRQASASSSSYQPPLQRWRFRLSLDRTAAEEPLDCAPAHIVPVHGRIIWECIDQYDLIMEEIAIGEFNSEAFQLTLETAVLGISRTRTSGVQNSDRLKKAVYSIQVDKHDLSFQGMRSDCEIQGNVHIKW